MSKQSHSGFGLLELMIALSLSTLIMLLLLQVFISTKNTYLKQMMFADIEDRMRFMSLYLSQQIRMAGNWSCESKAPKSNANDVRVYDANAANHRLGLTIKSNTDVLQLQECVRLHGVFQFLPVLFFVANTHRVTQQGKMIDALFIKIKQHPREELIPSVSDFQVKFIRAQQADDHDAVLINYVLSSNDDILKKPRAYWFQDTRILPSDLAFYQTGILLVTIARHHVRS